MKDLLSYVFPFLGLAVLAVCDYCFVQVNWFQMNNNNHPVFNAVVICVYNLLMLMSVWALLITFCSDPGYIPKGQQYDVNLLTQPAATLLRFAR